MTLAINSMHNLPPNLSYVSTLPESTQKPKRDTDELNHGLTDTWDHIPHDINNNSNNNIDFYPAMGGIQWRVVVLQ